RIGVAEHAHLRVTELWRANLALCCCTLAWRVPGYERCAGVFTSRVCARDSRIRRNLALAQDAGAYTNCVMPRTKTAIAPAAARNVASCRAIGVETLALTLSPSQAPTNSIAMATIHSHSGAPPKSTPPSRTSLSTKDTVFATTRTGWSVATNSR